MPASSVQLAAVALAGIAAGLWLLVRGFAASRAAARIGDTSTSRIATLAVGEVRVTGVVEPAELTLVSPLESKPCVYYRASIDALGDRSESTLFREERATGFRVRDESGSVRVFARDARFDIPLDFDESSDPLGGDPAGLRRRLGSAWADPEPSREAQVAALLTVRPPEPALLDGEPAASRHRRRRYREARLEPGDIVTVVGQALPFDQLADPAGADSGGVAASVAADDPELAASLALAAATGTLAASPEAAWGNAAIPGFGIGRPVWSANIDPAAAPPLLASPADADRAARRFEIQPDALVLAAGPDVPLVIAAGPPGEAVARREREFLVGLLGAVLAIASAIGLAALVGGIAR